LVTVVVCEVRGAVVDVVDGDEVLVAVEHDTRTRMATVKQMKIVQINLLFTFLLLKPFLLLFSFQSSTNLTFQIMMRSRRNSTGNFKTCGIPVECKFLLLINNNLIVVCIISYKSDLSITLFSHCCKHIVYVHIISLCLIKTVWVY
jgi:hypothetical protein